VTKTSDSDGRPGTSDVRQWAAFVVCSAIWGSTFLAISIGNDALAPVWAATLRLVLAAVLLFGWMLVRRQPMPRGAALHTGLAYGACQFGINLPLLYWGEKLIPSGLAAVLYATTPMSTALIARGLWMEPLTVRKAVGALTTFFGVVVLFSGSFGGPVAPLGLLAVFVAATVSAVGSILLKRGPRQSPIAANASGSAIGAVMAAAASLALGEAHVVPATAATLLPLLYLTLAGSLVAFVLASWLLNHWSATNVSYISVVVPVLAMGLGSVVRHEPLTLASLGGAALILAGLVIGMRAPAARRA
jgi:drug/metabolite transporter (DMT)-like permease